MTAALRGTVALALVLVPAGSAPAQWTEESHLIAPDGGAGDNAGVVAIAGDGSRLVIGVGAHDVGGAGSQGAAYVFARSGVSWSLEQQLTAPDGVAGDWFGTSVGISADGARVFVGAPEDDVGAAASQGSVYVFSRAGTAWSLEQKIVAADGVALDRLGTSVGVSGDGTRLVAGAPGRASYRGIAYVFSRSGSTWSVEATIVASDGVAGAHYGDALAVSADGARAIVGAPVDRAQSGTAYVIARSGSSWAEEARLEAPARSSNAYCGLSLAIAADGSRVLLGCPQESIGTGAVHVFSRTGVAWALESSLVPPSGVDRFGRGVALSADAVWAVVGCPGDPAATASGAVRVFRRTGTAWALDRRLLATDGSSGDQLGWGAAASSDASRIVAASWADDVGATIDQGSAYVFARGGLACASATDCVTGFCADGVCCESACGGSDPADCEACSVAAGADADGSCDPVRAGRSCRPAAGGCDLAESCNGAARACPADRLAPAGTECRASSGTCDVAEACTGAASGCPSDASAADGTSCADALACNGAEACSGGACAPATPLGCDDGDACTADGCAEPAGCTHTAIAACCRSDAECDDGDPCTVDRCLASACDHAAGGCDAGSAPDAAVVPLDAAGPVDAAVAPPDARPIDAGGTFPDAGAEPVPPPDRGTECGCSAAGAGSGSRAVVLLVALVLGGACRRRYVRSS